MKSRRNTLMALTAATLTVAMWPAAGTHADPKSGNSVIECVTAPSEAENVVLSCPGEFALPTSETSVVVDPADSSHVVAVAIDGRVPGNSIGFATSSDAGKTWTIGDIPHGPDTQFRDPWVGFDVKRGTVVISFNSYGANENLCPPPVEQLVTTSTDGGLNWVDPVVVHAGRGCYLTTAESQGFFESKFSVDNDPSSQHYGRIMMTGGYIACRNFFNCTYPIDATYSDDGGATWTKLQVISGASAQYCTAGGHPPACDNTFLPALPAFGHDGTAYVAIYNESNAAVWEPGEHNEGQIMVVSSTDGGATWSPPGHVVDLETGSRDYDCTSGPNGCRYTGIDLFPFYAMSNIAVGLDGTLYLAFSDNRNGVHDVPHPISNSDVFMMSSTDGGQTWSGPDVVSDAPGDQFKPAIAVNPATGKLGILFYDRNSDPQGKTMNVSLATGLPGSFSVETITTAPSHLSDDLWNAASVFDCHQCVFHLGEYIGLAYGVDGTANMTWTDLRNFTTTPSGRSGYAMNVDYARRESN